jgi:hypothetical protein
VQRQWGGADYLCECRVVCVCACVCVHVCVSQLCSYLLPAHKRKLQLKTTVCELCVCDVRACVLK